MIFVGIDVAKDKHDCFITNSDGEVLFMLWSSFFVTLLAKKNHYSVMQLPSLHVG